MSRLWSDRYRVIVPDLRGFGMSSKPAAPGAYGRPMTDDVIALLDSLGVDQAHFVGYSMGAMVTADATMRYPERLQSAVLVAGAFYPDSATFAHTVGGFADDIEADRGLMPFFRFIAPSWPDSALVPIEREIMAAHDKAALAAALRGIAGLLADSATIARIGTPAVAIVGRNDPLLEQSRWLARHWPGIELLELEDADHIVVFGAPEVVAAVRRLAPIP